MKGGLSALALVLLLACSKSTSKQAPEPANASASPPLPALVNPRAEPIPTEQDFEEEAAREIDTKSLAAELDALEKEIPK